MISFWCSLLSFEYTCLMFLTTDMHFFASVCLLSFIHCLYSLSSYLRPKVLLKTSKTRFAVTLKVFEDGRTLQSPSFLALIARYSSDASKALDIYLPFACICPLVLNERLLYHYVSLCCVSSITSLPSIYMFTLCFGVIRCVKYFSDFFSSFHSLGNKYFLQSVLWFLFETTCSAPAASLHSRCSTLQGVFLVSQYLSLPAEH